MRNIKAIIVIILILLILPVIFLVKDKVITLFSHAAAVPANIVVDASKSQATLERPWQGISQGGETEGEHQTLVALSPVNSQLKSLKPQFIRIDHVLERPYESRVREIVAAGATPFISLSYFPKDVSSQDIGTATNWQAWKKHVRDLVENVSGKNNMNIQGVYYEIWNEPDGEGFGGYSIGEGKDYFTLYKNTLEAVLTAQNVNDFKVGGPSLADLRRCTNGSILGLLKICQKYWLDQFLNLVQSSKSRLDFISWHRYSKNIADFNEDVNFINDQYLKYSSLPSAEKIITEWGSDPARSPIHNTVFDAAHLVAAARTFLGHVDFSTKFEVRDGPDSGDQGWGILRYGGQAKPTYEALQLLNKLRTERVHLSGEGSFVTGIASRDSSGVTVILSNYDSRQGNVESPPLTIKGLNPGKYKVSKMTINAPNCPDKSDEIEISDGVFNATDIPQCSGPSYQVMRPNSVVLYDLQLIDLQ